MRVLNAAVLCLMLVMGSTVAGAERIPPTFVMKVIDTDIMHHGIDFRLLNGRHCASEMVQQDTTTQRGRSDMTSGDARLTLLLHSSQSVSHSGRSLAATASASSTATAQSSSNAADATAKATAQAVANVCGGGDASAQAEAAAKSIATV